MNPEAPVTSTVRDMEDLLRIGRARPTLRGGPATYPSRAGPVLVARPARLGPERGPTAPAAGFRPPAGAARRPRRRPADSCPAAPGPPRPGGRAIGPPDPRSGDGG